MAQIRQKNLCILICIPEIPLRPEIRGAILDIGLPGGRRVDKGLEIYSDSALLWDVDTKVINYEKNGYRQRPIASITKLMTAMVALDYGFDWDEQMDIKPEEYLIGGKLLLQPGETVSMRDLMYASLLGSANNATMALVRGLEVPETEFIQAMNRKAIEMGLEKTEFVEVTGLDKENVSTAYEVARMAEEAFQSYIAKDRTKNSRSMCMLGAILFLMFSVIDVFALSATLKDVLLVRGIVIAGLMLGFVLTYQSYFDKYPRHAGSQGNVYKSHCHKRRRISRRRISGHPD